MTAWVIKNSEGDEYFSGFGAGGQIITVARAEYAMTFMAFATAQQFAHEVGEITGERWEVRQA